MTEEIAHVAGSTADTPGHVGRVSNALNQTTTERRVEPAGIELDRRDQHKDETKWTNTTHTAP